jgi:hypothetical protein
MPRGERRPGAGRPKGSGKGLPTMRGRAQIALAKEQGLSPLAFMLAVMNDETQDIRFRFEAAKNATPYVHARLAPKTADPDQAQSSDKAAEADWNELLVN